MFNLVKYPMVNLCEDMTFENGLGIIIHNALFFIHVLGQGVNYPTPVLPTVKNQNQLFKSPPPSQWNVWPQKLCNQKCQDTHTIYGAWLFEKSCQHCMTPAPFIFRAHIYFIKNGAYLSQPLGLFFTADNILQNSAPKLLHNST